MIKIVTDSTCDLPPEWFEQYKITRIPIHIQFGLETFREGITMTPNIFYDRIRTGDIFPTTSQPSVGEFRAMYESLASDGSEILSIHLTSKLSGTWQSARLAAEQLGDRVKVTVVDSLTSSAGLGFMVREAAQLVEAELTTAQIRQHLEARRSQIRIFIMLKDLQYARMSGRVGRLKEMLASLLQVKPIISADQGALVPLDRVRGQRQGCARMLTLLEEAVGGAPVHLAVAHALDPQHAANLLEQARARLNCQDTFIIDLALSLAVHFGPGTLGLAAYPAR